MMLPEVLVLEKFRREPIRFPEYDNLEQRIYGSADTIVEREMKSWKLDSEYSRQESLFP